MISRCVIILFTFASVINAQGEFPANFSSGDCQADSTILENADDFVDIREAFWRNNGLCFRILEEFGGEVQCTQSEDTLQSECQALHASQTVDSQELLFCTISAVGTLNAGNFSFDDGSRNFTFEFAACLPNECGNREDIQAYALSLLSEQLQNGDIEVEFNCSAFFDPVAAFWNENMLWIIIALGILVLCCVCGFLCCWWRKREEQKDKIQDPTLLYGPNLATYPRDDRPRPPPQEDSHLPRDEYPEDEETSSEEEELDEEDSLSESESESSSYHGPDERSEMGYHDEHPEVTVDAAMQQQQQAVGP